MMSVEKVTDNDQEYNDENKIIDHDEKDVKVRLDIKDPSCDEFDPDQKPADITTTITPSDVDSVKSETVTNKNVTINASSQDQHMDITKEKQDLNVLNGRTNDNENQLQME